MEEINVEESNTRSSCGRENHDGGGGGGSEAENGGLSFCKKCGYIVKKQRAKFYILRRCISMLLCWHEHS